MPVAPTRRRQRLAVRRRGHSPLSRARDFGQILFRSALHEKGGRAAAFFMQMCCIRADQEPAPESVVTARRFCDQQEMSSHTATGRSLP